MQKVLIIEDDHFSARRLKRLIMDIDDTIDVHGPLKKCGGGDRGACRQQRL